MNVIMFPFRRPVTAMMLVVGFVSGGMLAMKTMRAGSFPPLNTPKVYASLDSASTIARQMKEYVVSQFESFFKKHEEEHHEESQKIVVTSPKAMEVTITQPYVCQIHSQQHINVSHWKAGISRRSWSGRARR